MLILTSLCVSSCQSNSEIKYEQYVISGKILYEQNCSNCHGKDGQGLRDLYPSVTRSNRLKDINYLTCLIKNGTKDREVNMPSHKHLYNLDIAQIITYLNHTWGDSKTLIETDEVAKVNC